MEPKCRAKPYEGSEPFIFFSYCHKDSAVVYPLIEALTQMGYRIWFDSGITIGDEWPEVIADKLENCAAFLPYISATGAVRTPPPEMASRWISRIIFMEGYSSSAARIVASLRS